MTSDWSVFFDRIRRNVMPELPEVETLKRGLDTILLDQQFTQISGDKVTPDFKHIGHQTVTAIDRQGKMLIINFQNNYSLLLHLKMTGQLIFRGLNNPDGNVFAGGHPTNSLEHKLPDRSTRIIFKLKNGTLYFNDQRKFAVVNVLPTSKLSDVEFLDKLGPEPFAISNQKKIATDLIKRHKSIKACLLDQHIIAGIGNIYADETLWKVKVHPLTPPNVLSEKQLFTIVRTAGAVMDTAITEGGTTFDGVYKNISGGPGLYQPKIYGHSGGPCPRCKTTLAKIRVAGRGTTFCPKCQVKV